MFERVVRSQAARPLSRGCPATAAPKMLGHQVVRRGPGVIGRIARVRVFAGRTQTFCKTVPKGSGRVDGFVRGPPPKSWAHVLLALLWLGSGAVPFWLFAAGPTIFGPFLAPPPWAVGGVAGFAALRSVGRDKVGHSPTERRGPASDLHARKCPPFGPFKFRR